jgi:myosin heavy subunit
MCFIRKLIPRLSMQRCFRGSLGRERFFSVWEREQAALVIQQYFRRYNAELDFLEEVLERDAAIHIQTCWRALKERRRFQTTVVAAIGVQRVAKGYLVRKDLQHQHLAAMTIQQAWWSWVDYADSQVAAILIQSRWRGISARRFSRDLAVRHQAATDLQKVWRGYFQTIVFAITREVSISIQKVARGYLVRKNLPIQRMSRAAILLQKSWRGFSAQIQYNLDVMDIVSIQTLARARIAQKIVKRRSTAVAGLQGAVRCALSRRALLRLRLEQEHEIRRNNAAIVCQVSPVLTISSVSTFEEYSCCCCYCCRSVLYAPGKQRMKCSFISRSARLQRRFNVLGVALSAGVTLFRRLPRSQ